MNKPPGSQVQVWIAREQQLAGDHYESVLSDDERLRWQRLRMPADRNRFLQARMLVRSVLGAVLGIEPAVVAFTAGPHGKPQLATGGWQFNLSHTRGLLVLAVSRERAVGVDVEAIDRRVEMLALSKRFFAAQEHDALLDLDGDAQRERFFALWTLKEAWLKARGLGLRVPLDDFRFTFNGKQPLIAFGPQLDEDPKGWQFRTYARERFRIALAVQGVSGVDVQLRDWKP
jgi:4'-phosphopantetheinyl transferase